MNRQFLMTHQHDEATKLSCCRTPLNWKNQSLVSAVKIQVFGALFSSETRNDLKKKPPRLRERKSKKLGASRFWFTPQKNHASNHYDNG